MREFVVWQPIIPWRSRCWRTSPREIWSRLPLVGQHRGTHLYASTLRADEDAPTRAIIALAPDYGRYGYRHVTALLQAVSWQVDKDRVQRIWRREGLKVPQMHRPRGRLWLNDGSCVRLRPPHRSRVWSFDFVQRQTHDGQSLRIPTLVDEYRPATLPQNEARRINNVGVINTLAKAMCPHGIPENIRCDIGLDMISKDLHKWIAKAGSQILYIAPRAPRNNRFCEIFNGKLKDECLKQEIFFSPREALTIIGL